MATPPASDASLFFNDGCAVRRDTVLLAAQFNAFPDADASRLAMLVDGDWLHRDVRGDTIRSVTFHPGTQRCHFMGRNGLIVTGGGGSHFGRATIVGTFTEATIRDVDRYGGRFRIRFVCGAVYACGESSQIYRLERGSWVHFDHGLLTARRRTRGHQREQSWGSVRGWPFGGPSRISTVGDGNSSTVPPISICPTSGVSPKTRYTSAGTEARC